MRKLSTVTIDDRPPRKRRVGLLLLAGPLLTLSPFIYEFALVCVMRWKGMFGIGMQVKTPYLDAAGDFVTAGRSLVLLQSHSFFHQGAWSTTTVIGAAIFFTGTLAMLLRKC